MDVILEHWQLFLAVLWFGVLAGAFIMALVTYARESGHDLIEGSRGENVVWFRVCGYGIGFRKVSAGVSIEGLKP